MMAAIVVLSDPKSGSEESLGRLFNALAAAYDFKQRGDDVTLLFQGAGTRWAGEVVKADHPAHALYRAVEDTVAGVSCGCADVFGASEQGRALGLRAREGKRRARHVGAAELARARAAGLLDPHLLTLPRGRRRASRRRAQLP